MDLGMLAVWRYVLQNVVKVAENKSMGEEILKRIQSRILSVVMFNSTSYLRQLTQVNDMEFNQSVPTEVCMYHV